MARLGLRWIVTAWLAMGAFGVIRWLFFSFLEIRVLTWLPSLGYSWFEAIEELVFRLVDLALEALVVVGVLRLRGLVISSSAKEDQSARKLVVPLAVVLVASEVLLLLQSGADFNATVHDGSPPAALLVAVVSATAVLRISESALFALWSTRVARALGRPGGWLGVLGVTFAVLHSIATTAKPWLREAFGRRAPVGFIALPFGFVAVGALMLLLLRILEATRDGEARPLSRP